jgi:phage-related protein
LAIAGTEKPILWIGSSRKDLKGFPKKVRSTVGQALFHAQKGKKHLAVKPLKGYGGASVLEVVEDEDGSTYRAVYTVKFSRVICVLHVFQKKSKSGSKTPVQNIDKVNRRLREAETRYAEWLQSQESSDHKGS